MVSFSSIKQAPVNQQEKDRKPIKIWAKGINKMFMVVGRMLMFISIWRDVQPH